MIERTVDVVVVGYGGAGAFAAIEAQEAGAKVLLAEKSAHHGGLTMLCSGFMRVATAAAGAAAYLSATSGGRVPEALIRQLAEGMVEAPEHLERLAKSVGAKVRRSFGSDQQPQEVCDLYDWPGGKVLGWSGIEEVPGFNSYPWVSFGSYGQLLMRVLEANVEARGIQVWLSSPAQRLLIENGRVRGVVVRHEGEEVLVHARGGVVLACGGFEFDRQMLADFMETPALYGIGHPGNTGDGIRMAQQAGASLWHMWHIHGSYGFKFPEYTVAFRNHLGGARREDRKLAWILVDQHGRRFANEIPPAPQDVSARPLDQLNPERGSFDRIPAWMVFDDEARGMGPIARPIAAVPEHYYEWSADNSAEVDRGWILRGHTLRALAGEMGVPADAFEATVNAWNNSVATQKDSDFSRPPGTMTAMSQPPFYAVQVWPVVSNTQGGPKHDECQRVLDAFGQPISGLYAAGELGSLFGHIYLLGGNLTEGLVGGRIAGRRAALGLDA
ncbi:MAG: FAD-binding protein [Chloroflexota bacterium]